MKKIFVYMTCIRFMLHWIYYKNAINKSYIKEDVCRNSNLFMYRDINCNLASATFYEFCYLMSFYKMFRNIFYARVAKYHHFYSKFLSIFASPLPLLDISASAEIGGGLVIQHGYGTIVAPKRIGKNCWINQGVTIGYTNDVDCPILGDDVFVYSGAKVLGDVRIGNNVKIGANAVVVSDVCDNCIVAGVPAKIIKNIIR